MRHGIFGKQLSRSSNERKALIRNIMRSLVLHGSIKTSKAKAQASRSAMEKLITKAKKGTDAAKRDVLAHLPDKEVAKKLIAMSETRFASRNSGYTRIIKMGARFGDSSEQVILSFVDEEITQEVVKPEGKDAKKAQTKEVVKKETKPKKTETKAKLEKKSTKTK